jgi:ribonuclease P protein subunit RPR2
MVRIAHERITELFGLAEQEARRTDSALPERYVALARRIGMRYNVRLLPEYQELYCRGCGAYWTEGRTVRTRLRAGRRSRTCLRCGRVRRVPLRAPPPAAPPPELGRAPPAQQSGVVLAEDGIELGLEGDEGEDE